MIPLSLTGWTCPQLDPMLNGRGTVLRWRATSTRFDGESLCWGLRSTRWRTPAEWLADLAGSRTVSASAQLQVTVRLESEARFAPGPPRSYGRLETQTPAQVIGELNQLAREAREANTYGGALGLAVDELAVCDALLP